MQYIVKEKMIASLGKIQDVFEPAYYVVALTDEQLAKGGIDGDQIEMDHAYEILSDEEKRQGLLAALSCIKNEPVLFAYFSNTREKQQPAHYVYKINRRKWERLKLLDTSSLLVSCEAEDTFLASDYLRTVATLHELADTLNRKLVIWGNVQSELPYYRRNALTEDMVSYYINKYKSLYLLPTTFDETLQRRGHNMASFWQMSELEKIIRSWLGDSKIAYDLGQKSRGSLFFDQCQLMVPISTLQEEQQTKEINSFYTGEQVWVGILTEEHGHYQKASLLDRNNKMRVVGVWQQDSGEKGHYITGSELTKVKGENASLDHLLEMIGGKGMGLATSTQFIIGKMKRAREDKEGVRWEDLKEAAEKLMRLAQENKRFLILVIPYEGYLIPCSEYNEWLEDFAKKTGRLVIIPAGDRGDKGQSLSFEGEAITRPVSLMIKKPTTVVGEIMLRHSELGDFYLISPEGRKILLTKSGRQTVGEITLYVEEKDELKTGEKPLCWTMENLEKGKWQLQMTIADKGLASGKMILQTPVKNAIRLCGAKGEGTLAQADQKGIISVGCFCEEQQVLYGFSGRGDRRHYPTLVVSDGFLKNGRWESTLSATGFFTGMIACLVQKWQQEGRVVSEGTLKKCLLWELIRMQDSLYPDINYPDSGQGYGILTVHGVTRLLGKEG